MAYIVEIEEYALFVIKTSLTMRKVYLFAIRKYATVDDIKYVFFDYIHTTASLVEQFTRNNLREDVVLMLLANQLKQLAKDYKQSFEKIIKNLEEEIDC